MWLFERLLLHCSTSKDSFKKNYKFYNVQSCHDFSRAHRFFLFFVVIPSPFLFFLDFHGLAVKSETKESAWLVRAASASRAARNRLREFLLAVTAWQIKLKIEFWGRPWPCTRTRGVSMHARVERASEGFPSRLFLTTARWAKSLIQANDEGAK